MQSELIPECVRRLLWDVDPGAVDLALHRDYVMERLMSRGSWDAMRWLRTRYSRDEISDFLQRRCARLTARDRAYWALVAGQPTPKGTGGGRPAWAG